MGVHYLEAGVLHNHDYANFYTGYVILGPLTECYTRLFISGF